MTEVEDLTIASCETEPFFSTVGGTMGDSVLLPRLRGLTINIGCGELDISALFKCAKARKEHSRPLGGATIVFEKDPEGDLAGGVEVGELIYRIGGASELC